MCLAIPGRILEITGDDDLSRAGRIDFGGVIREASLAAVPEARVGDFVIVHAGVALSVLDEEEARLVFETLRELDAAEMKAASDDRRDARDDETRD
jgi:hydrogenase expression/formation protein HypC